MIFLKSLGYTLLVALTAIILIATLYASMWIMLAIAVILVFTAIYNLLKGHKHLLNDSSEL